jgi:hypothetical protein
MRAPILAIISAALLIPGAAQAMTIVQFDKMADKDQADYIGDLIVGAEKILTDTGKPTLATQVRRLFTTKDPGDADTIGMVELERNIAISRVADLKRVQSNPSARRLEVEDAMFITLKKNTIELPDSFFSVNANFRPKLPQRH